MWDLALVRDESTLISCDAEGSVKVWDVSGPSGGGSLRLSWSYDGLDVSSDGELTADNGDVPGATAVEAIKTDLKKVAVAYQNVIIKIFDIETGKELMKLHSDVTQGKISWVKQHSAIDGPLQTVRRLDKSTVLFPIPPCPSWSPATRTSTFAFSTL